MLIAANSWKTGQQSPFAREHKQQRSYIKGRGFWERLQGEVGPSLVARNPWSRAAFSTGDTLSTDISAEEVTVLRGPDRVLSQEQITEGFTLSGSFLIAENTPSPRD